LPSHPDIELRTHSVRGETVTVAVPYGSKSAAGISDALREMERAEFDVVTREWWLEVGEWTGLDIAGLVGQFPELTTDETVDEWLASLQDECIARVGAIRHEGEGWWQLMIGSGELPEAFRSEAREVDGLVLVPMRPDTAAALRGMPTMELTEEAGRCADLLAAGELPPAARMTVGREDGMRVLELEVLWDREAATSLATLPGAGESSVLADSWYYQHLEPLLERHEVELDEDAAALVAAMAKESERLRGLVERSEALEAEPLAGVELAGELEPFQWAAVRYVLDVRRTFLADEQGLGKTVEALASLEADDAYPAVIVCPASLKLNWEREVRRWLPQRSVRTINGRDAVVEPADLTIVNYELVAKHLESLKAVRPSGLVIDESHYVKNPSAQRTKAVRHLAGSMVGDGLRLALSGTPIVNGPTELVAQLRILDQLESFGTGAAFSRRFAQGPGSLERLHWHLRRHCFVRRLKRQVLPQLPAKRRVTIPIPLANEPEYRAAERNIVAWLRAQPLDLNELETRVAQTLRAERLAQLGVLQRLSATGKLGGAIEWISDFLASGEPLVVFARHVAVQEAVLEAFPKAVHLLGSDSLAQREEAVAAFQDRSGPQLLVCSMRVAGTGFTLTRASNVCFLELDWTPAAHEQAEDRCHRIGQQGSAVTAWYLLAANTIDETMANLLERKRSDVSLVTQGHIREDEPLLGSIVSVLRSTRS
jgi:SWI/SNF-related matrix-associated actin-dependent regulator of chromatin subfamily A-like protein 1